MATIRNEKYYDLIQNLKNCKMEFESEDNKYWSILKSSLPWLPETMIFFEPSPLIIYESSNKIGLTKLQKQKYDNLKLSIESVPSNCSDASYRHISKKQWENVRSQAFVKANFKCEICNELSPKLECHESWVYNEISGNQILINLVSLCDSCHNVKHIWQNWMKDYTETFLFAINKFETLNKLSHKEAILFIDYSIQILFDRGKIDWGLDISLLEEYGIELPKKIFQYSERKVVKRERF